MRLFAALLIAATPIFAAVPATAATHRAPAIAAVSAAAIAAAVADPARPEKDRALDASRKPAEMLAFMQVKPGQRVLDAMSGAGYYTRLIGRLVGPSGHVFAWEPNGFAPPQAKVTELYGPIANATFVVSQPDDFNMPPASLDAVLFHLNYHDLYWESAKYHLPKSDPARYLKMVYAALRPGGTVTVIDHVALPGDTRADVEKYHRIDPATVKADFAAAGFKLDGESNLLAVATDDHGKGVFDPEVRGKTDRFAFRFRKPV